MIQAVFLIFLILMILRFQSLLIVFDGDEMSSGGEVVSVRWTMEDA